MSTTVTFKLNKDAHQFQAGESLGFGIRGGVQYYDRETKQKEWTNYEAVIFAKNPNQIAFYQQNLVEGSIVEVTGKQEKIRQFQGNNGLSLSIELIDASVGYVGSVGGQQSNQGRQQGTGAVANNGTQGFQQAPQRKAPPQQFGQNTGQPAPAPQSNWDDSDVPF